MFFIFLVNIIIPIIAGMVYFIMAAEVHKLGKVRKIIFGEIGYQKISTVFILFGIYFLTRPLQELLGPHPLPMIINNIRQFFLMAIISPLILLGIFYWDSNKDHLPKSTVITAYLTGFLMATIFILVNRIAITDSKIIASLGGINLYDAVWFSSGKKATELIFIHLICQLISPVGFFILATAIVRRRRHDYPINSIYNLMPLKWKYLETGLIIFIASLIIAGIAAIIGRYYTYLWVIYFVGAIISGLFELKSVKIPPRTVPSDLAD